MQAVLWIRPVMYKSIYGRFPLLQLGTASNIVILNVLISVYNVAGRLATRQVTVSDCHRNASFMGLLHDRDWRNAVQRCDARVEPGQHERTLVCRAAGSSCRPCMGHALLRPCLPLMP